MGFSQALHFVYEKEIKIHQLVVRSTLGKTVPLVLSTTLKTMGPVVPNIDLPIIGK